MNFEIFGRKTSRIPSPKCTNSYITKNKLLVGCLDFRTVFPMEIT